MSYLRAAKSAMSQPSGPSSSVPDTLWSLPNSSSNNTTRGSSPTTPPVEENPKKLKVHVPYPHRSGVAAEDLSTQLLSNRADSLQKAASTSIVGVNVNISNSTTNLQQGQQYIMYTPSQNSSPSSTLSRDAALFYPRAVPLEAAKQYTGELHLPNPLPSLPGLTTNSIILGNPLLVQDPNEYCNYEYPQRYFTTHNASTSNLNSNNNTTLDSCDTEMSAIYYDNLCNYITSNEWQGRSLHNTHISSMSLAESMSASSSYTFTPIESLNSSRESSPPLPLVNSNGKCRQLPCRFVNECAVLYSQYYIIYCPSNISLK